MKLKVLALGACMSLVALGVTLIGAGLAVAQDASSGATDFNPAVQIVGWVCSNQNWVIYVLGLLAAHFGLSGASAILKKFGITEDSPALGLVVKVIRALAMDVKPPPATIVAQAAAIQEKDPSMVAPGTQPIAKAPPPGPSVVQP